MKIRQILMPAAWGSKSFENPPLSSGMTQAGMFQSSLPALSSPSIDKGLQTSERANLQPGQKIQFGWNWRDKGKRLHHAARRNQVDKLNQLLDQGVDVNVTDQYGATPLMVAVDARAYEAATALLDRGAQIDVEDNQGYSALLYHVASKSLMKPEQQAALTSRLIHKPLIDHRYYNGATALGLTTEAGESESALLLIAAGADVRLADNKQMTPLMYTAWNNHPDVAEALILALPQEERKAYINAKNKFGRNALDIARGWQDKRTAALLVRYGGKPTQQVNPWEDADDFFRVPDIFAPDDPVDLNDKIEPQESLPGVITRTPIQAPDPETSHTPGQEPSTMPSSGE